MTDTRDRHVIKGGTIVTATELINNGWISIINGKIEAIGVANEYKELHPKQVTTIKNDSYIFPGFIDVHIHGANGADVMDGTKEALDTITKALPMEGTTSFLATTMTQSKEDISKALKNIATFMKTEYSGAEIIGVHLEGPFINPMYAGAQPMKHIISPNIHLFNEWNKEADENIRLVTFAPEEDEDNKLVKLLNSKGIIASVGHSHASYDEIKEAVTNGLSHATHLFNAMRPMHHREPGVVGTAFLEDKIMAEIIFDKVHVSNEMVRLAFMNKGSDKIQLITDSMRAKCLRNGTYDLGGQEVTLKGTEARLSDGTLAGSVLKMNEAIKNADDLKMLSLLELAKISSTNAAKELGIFDRKGSIEVGKDADLVILDHQFEVQQTYCRGLLNYTA